MTPAVYDQTSADIEAIASDKTVYGLRASGRILKFSGWLEAYGKGETPKSAAPLASGEEDASVGLAPAAARDLLAEDAEGEPPRADRGPGAAPGGTPRRRDGAEVHAASPAV